MAAPSKAWVCGSSQAGIAISNPAGSWIFVCCDFLCRQVDVLSRGVLPSVVCPIRVIAKPSTGRPCPGIGSRRARGKKKKVDYHGKCETDEKIRHVTGSA